MDSAKDAITVGFKTDLFISLKQGSDRIYVLTEPLKYYSDIVGLIIVPAGFNTDFASVPRLPVIYSLWGDRAHREAVLHDYLFRKDAIPYASFMDANRVFLEAMKVREKPFYIRHPMFIGVCVGGYPSYHKRKVMDVL